MDPMTNSEPHTPQRQFADLDAQISWKFFLIDDVWMAVTQDEVISMHSTDSLELQQADVTGGWRSPGFKETIWLCDAELKPIVREGEIHGQILKLRTAADDFAIICDKIEDVLAGPLVSIHPLPAVLSSDDKLVLALIVPDKHRVASVVDVNKLGRMLVGESFEVTAGVDNG